MARNKQDKQKVSVAVPAAPRLWRLKDKAPPHYVQGQDIKVGGEEFAWPTKMSDHCVEVSAPEPASQEPEGKDEAAPAVVASVESEQEEEAASAASESESSSAGADTF